MTDWGAHHLDIAQWGINRLPVEIEGQAKYPNVADGYNVAIDFGVTYKYANGVDDDRSRHRPQRDHVHRRRRAASLSIAVRSPANRWKTWQQSAARDQFALYDFDNLDRPERAGKLDAIVNHMGNFFDCVESRKAPISDVESQHRSVSTCHLGNISMRLGRKLKWDPQSRVVC